MARTGENYTSEQIEQLTAEKLALLLTPKQVKVAMALAEASRSIGKIAEENDIDRNTINNWKNNPIFLEYVAREIKRINERVVKIGLGNKDHRVNLLEKLADTTTEKLNTLAKKKNNFKAYQIIAKEFRENIRGVAEELGQLEEKLNVTGSVVYRSNIERKGKKHGGKVSGS